MLRITFPTEDSCFALTGPPVSVSVRFSTCKPRHLNAAGAYGLALLMMALGFFWCGTGGHDLQHASLFFWVSSHEKWGNKTNKSGASDQITQIVTNQ